MMWVLHDACFAIFNTNPKVTRRDAFVVCNGGVCLDFKELLDDTSVAYPGDEVECCIAKLVTGIDNVCQEAHKGGLFGLGWLVLVFAVFCRRGCPLRCLGSYTSHEKFK